jgi:hypothetical protein
VFCCAGLSGKGLGRSSSRRGRGAAGADPASARVCIGTMAEDGVGAGAAAAAVRGGDIRGGMIYGAIK